MFDLDGLMFNTEDLYQDVGGEILRRRGQAFSAELLDAMMGRPASIALQLMIDAHQLDNTVEQLAAETDEIFAGLLDERLATMPGLLELLSELEQAKIPKAIATSSGPDFVHRVLGKFDLARAAVAAGTVAVAVPSGHSLTHDFTGAALIASSLADERLRDLLGLPRERR